MHLLVYIYIKNIDTVKYIYLYEIKTHYHLGHSQINEKLSLFAGYSNH